MVNGFLCYVKNVNNKIVTSKIAPNHHPLYTHDSQDGGAGGGGGAGSGGGGGGATGGGSAGGTGCSGSAAAHGNASSKEPHRGATTSAPPTHGGPTGPPASKGVIQRRRLRAPVWARSMYETAIRIRTSLSPLLTLFLLLSP